MKRPPYGTDRPATAQYWPLCGVCRKRHTWNVGVVSGRNVWLCRHCERELKDAANRGAPKRRLQELYATEC